MMNKNESEASVLAVLDELTAGSHRLLLTKRASFLRSHPGEVSFPGGMREPVDDDLQQTALRESREEVGLDSTKIEMLDALSMQRSRHGVSVTPFVACLKQRHHLRPSLDELESLFWVPMSLFLDDHRSKTHVFSDADGRQSWSPVYEYEGHAIWGLTAKIIVDLVAWRYQCILPRRHARAPEWNFKR